MWEITYTLFALLLAIWYLWRWRLTSIFSKLGIPGPKPGLLFGNLLELYWKGPMKCHNEWVEKYGNVLGYYYGMKPVLLVADPMLLKNIFIKDFSKFTNRELFNPIVNPVQTEGINQSVLSVRGQKWKEIRSVLTPTFSTAKMKQMAVTMNSSIDEMISILKEKAGSGTFFDIHETYKKLTLDVIARTSFGVQMDIQRDGNPSLLKSVKLLFRAPYRSILIFFGLSFPLLRTVFLEMQFMLLRILNRGTSPIIFLRKGLQKVLGLRRENPKHRKADLLQLMIDAKISVDVSNIDVRKLEAGDPDIETAADEDKEDSKVTRHMSNDEIIASAVVVLLAGYETTSTALSFTTYLLAKHPDIQEKAYEEIKELVQSGEKLEYGTINRLPYLENVLNESLRLYPPVFLFTNRYAAEDITYGHLKIPKDMIVQAPAYQLHHDPDYWPDPETFDPSRFDTKPNSNGIIFFPFGIGPRNCLGMRFAQMEAKLALAHTIYNYRIELAEEQKEELPVSEFIRTLAPSRGVLVRVHLRESEEN